MNRLKIAKSLVFASLLTGAITTSTAVFNEAQASGSTYGGGGTTKDLVTKSCVKYNASISYNENGLTATVTATNGVKRKCEKGAGFCSASQETACE